MNLRTHLRSIVFHPRRTWPARAFSVLAIFAMALNTLGSVSAAPAARTATLQVALPTAYAINLRVSNLADNTDIAAYKWIINVDNTGDPLWIENDCRPTVLDANGDWVPNPDNPDPDGLTNCQWPSVRGVQSSSPIFTQGTSDELNGAANITLPAGKYLISVIADGFKIDGKHFSIPMEESAPGSGVGLVEVQMQPLALPAATLRIKVFVDSGFANGQFDAPAEEPQLPDGNPALASKIVDGQRVGFKAHLGDPLGEISTDVFGNPLCTEYDADGNPLPGNDQSCLFADEFGNIAIPNVGPNRYEVWVVPPDGEAWVETTTLEGNFGWDTWLQEGATGYDTEFVVGAEPFPWTIFGFVPGGVHYRNGSVEIATAPTNSDGLVTGGIEGDVHKARVYVPWNAGNPYNGDVWGGFKGVRDAGPMAGARIALSSIDLGDTLVYVGQADNNGHFEITNVPDGNYTLTFWDDPLLYILDFQQVTVANGAVTNMTDTNHNGVLEPALGESPLHLTGWWTTIEGTVFLDDDSDGIDEPTDGNGVRDPGEPGVFNYPLVIRKRDNSIVERGAVATVTGADGSYEFKNTYPFGWWMVLEAYTDLYYTTGVTMYNVDFTTTPDNDPDANPLNPPLIQHADAVTIIGQGVDVSFLPIIGQTGRIDWGVRPYDPRSSVLENPAAGGPRLQNGGIVGTVSYDVTRNELDPRYAAVENWQPGIPGLTVNLYKAVRCTNPATQSCDPTRKFQVDPLTGAFLKGDENGVPTTTPIQWVTTESWEQPIGCIARDASGLQVVEQALPRDTANGRCLEGPMMGMQFGQDFTAVNGNYGFGGIPAGNYLVEVVIPTEGDVYGADAVFPDRPLYQVTREDDVNVFSGDEYTPLLAPPMCAGPLQLVDSSDNPTFAAEGGSPWEGVKRPTCDVKLVTLGSGRSIAPTFNLFTDVPIPGKYHGYIIDDLNLATDPRALFFGEKNGIAAPVGIYDFSNRLVTTVNSDPHGVFEVLLPSTGTINCPSPSGICANVYRLVGNDPGQPGRFNDNYNPQYRTISANFEVWPGIIIAADLAPTQMAVFIQAPGSQFNNVAQCRLDNAAPQLFAVSPQPYVTAQGAFTIRGLGFGATAGQVLLDGSLILPATSWTDRQIAVTVPPGTPAGPHQLSIKASNGQTTVNGLTFHVFSGFPSSAVLDDFNRTSSPLGANWAGPMSQETSAYRIQTFGGARQVQVRVTGANGSIFWNAPGVSNFGPDQEAFFTFTDVSNTATEQNLLLKVTGLDPGATIGASTAMIEVRYDRANSQVRIETLAGGVWVSHTPITGVTFANGDQFGARALADGTVNVYKNGALLGSTNVVTGGWPAALAAGGGQIGVWFLGTGNSGAADAHFDNFGGGNASTLSYNPALFEVGPGKTYDPAAIQYPVQAALDAAANAGGEALVVVYPGPQGLFNPHGVYYENIIMHSPVKLQGVGPGGTYADNTGVLGSVISGLGFGADTQYAEDWRIRLLNLDIATPGTGELLFAEGQTVTVVATDTEQYDTPAYKAAIDGFGIQGGDQMGFPNNLNQIGGGQNGLPAVVETQGGGLFVYAYSKYLQITNNHIKNNSGSYAGGIRIGTPNWEDSHNDDMRIANNRIYANGGSNLAGGIGVFEGTRRYEIAGNDLCGNFSAEYGGGISVYGFSPDGKIHHNRIYFNRSYDEGGGIMLAGELPADPLTLSPGTGAADIYANLIQANLANDDGGGLRFLMAGNFPMNVYNNFIVNNVSTHEGGGVALDDTPDVRFFNNTVMKNLTTATAMTSDGNPAPAGLSTTFNSAALQATLPPGSPEFSNPLMFNNIFWDNRAGSWDIARTAVSGIGLAGDPNPIRLWDMGSTDGSGPLAPTNSMLNEAALSNIVPDASNQIGVNPQVISTYDTSVAVMPWRTMPGMTGIALVAVELPPNLLGNYHLQAGSPARNTGAASKTVGLLTVNAPASDVDGDPRPSLPGFEIGADEYPVIVYLTLSANSTTLPVSTGGTATFANEDILAFNGVSFDMVFDGSDVITGNMGGVRIDDFVVLSPTRILMSFTDPLQTSRLPGIPAAFGPVDDSDIVQFDATSLGNVTAGTFSIYFDGSDVGLTTNGEDVNSLEVLPNGDLVLSTVAAVTVPELTGVNTGRHLLRCGNGTYGESTACTWSIYFDGTDVGLNETGDEVIDGHATAANGDIYLSTTGGFSVPLVPPLSGANEDIFVCRPIALGETTTCIWSRTLFFDGSVFGLGSNNVTGIELP
jgi:hypothetical protein